MLIHRLHLEGLDHPTVTTMGLPANIVVCLRDVCLLRRRPPRAGIKRRLPFKPYLYHGREVGGNGETEALISSFARVPNRNLSQE